MADQEPVTDPLPTTIAGMREVFLAKRFPAGDPRASDPLVVETFDAAACFVVHVMSQALQHLHRLEAAKLCQALCAEAVAISEAYEIEELKEQDSACATDSSGSRATTSPSTGT